MHPNGLETRAEKERLIRSAQDKIDEINRVGKIKQIRINKKEFYAGLVIKTEPKEKYTYLHIINGNQKIGPQVIKIPKEIYEDSQKTKIHTRNLIEPGFPKEDQFIPLDKNGKITTDPQKVTSFQKESLETIFKNL
ncbi:MAG TPA: hypothetical protein VKO61_00515 [Candidatus Paceibacterota bacterium]|nr:hypothetical protein [Candidatus Paceibacterota bacterium]